VDFRLRPTFVASNVAAAAAAAVASTNAWPEFAEGADAGVGMRLENGAIDIPDMDD
jgi:hypothetical protein